VLDRSIFSDWVFAEKNRLDGNIDADGFFFYSQLRDQMLESLPFPHVTIYLDVPPQLCHQRIHGLRCRAEEVDSGIPLEYLEGLHRCYQQFLAQMGGRGSHVVQLPWSSFGSAAQIVAAVAESAPQPAWHRASLRAIVDSPAELASRTRLRGVDSWEDDSEDEALARVDLDSSNSDELLAMSKQRQQQQTAAPSSPVQADE
jgi:hypothetical protein